MALFERFRGKDVGNSAPAEARSCSHNTANALVLAELKALSARVDRLQETVNALNQLAMMLQQKTWSAYHARRVGRIAGGAARAAAAARDDRGRFLPS